MKPTPCPSRALNIICALNTGHTGPHCGRDSAGYPVSWRDDVAHDAQYIESSASPTDRARRDTSIDRLAAVREEQAHRAAWERGARNLFTDVIRTSWGNMDEAAWLELQHCAQQLIEGKVSK